MATAHGDAVGGLAAAQVNGNVAADDAAGHDEELLALGQPLVVGGQGDINKAVADAAKAERDAEYAAEFRCRVVAGALCLAVFFGVCNVLTWFRWPVHEERAARATTTLDGLRGRVCVSAIEGNYAAANTHLVRDNCAIIAPPNSTALERKSDGSCCVPAAGYKPIVADRVWPYPAFAQSFDDVRAAFLAFLVLGVLHVLLTCLSPLHHLCTRGHLVSPRAALLRKLHLAGLALVYAGALAAAWAAFALEQELFTMNAFYLPPNAPPPPPGAAPSARGPWSLESLGFEVPKTGRLIAGVGYTLAPLLLGLTLYVFRRISVPGAVDNEADVPAANEAQAQL